MIYSLYLKLRLKKYYICLIKNLLAIIAIPIHNINKQNY